MINAAWAKLDEHGQALPLADHATDVASVMRALLADTHWRLLVMRCADRALSACDQERLVVLAFLHDLGKANAGFWRRQFPGAPVVGHTNETAALFFVRSIRQCSAPTRLHAILNRWGAEDLFMAAMAHHGVPLAAYASEGLAARRAIEVDRFQTEQWTASDGYDPQAQLQALLDEAERRFPLAFQPGPKLPNAPAFVSLFCGLLTLADWLGSDTTLFPIAQPLGAARDTLRTNAIGRVLGSRGLALLATPACSFAAAFDVPGPRGMQAAADDLALGDIALLEAETGSGKTEAALWRWLALRRSGLVDGLYFALPTRSAAVQLHGRVQAMLRNVFGPAAPVAVLAVPGYLRAGDAEGQTLPAFRVAWSDGTAGDERWAAERPKRFLAARVAVGTIDQVLMAGLKLRHAHLRAACLARSLLVVDEVHASDVFMGAVLEQVLSNHRALGGQAMLLSATLSSAARGRLLGCPEPGTLDAASAVRYPSLSGTARAPERGVRVAGKKPVRLAAEALIDDPPGIAARAIAAARSGASVLVVRNSVAGAVAVARAVEAAAPELAFRVKGVPTLHHGRFGPDDRRLLDAAVEAAFGKTRDARGRTLCGTQTLEQSLDLDADFLITDLAPMDVLLQRIGRLHRHPRSDRGAHADAAVMILVPAERDLTAFLGRVRDRHGLGPHRDGTGVYPDLLTLEATWRLIEANPVIDIPRDNRRLVEGALHHAARTALETELGTAWINHAAMRDGTEHAERQQARHWSLDLTAAFDTLLFPRDEAIATRLGLHDRLVDFDPPLPGPFGQPAARLTIPGWMAGDMPLDARPAVLGAVPAGAAFQIGEQAFTYGRYGLQVGADAT